MQRKCSYSKVKPNAGRILKIGMVANLSKKSVIDIVREAISYSGDTEVFLENELARKLGHKKGATLDKLGRIADMILVFGGDGTMLWSARQFAKFGKPLLGVNIGRLGFLTELLPDELPDALPKILAGDYEIDERMMLETNSPRIIKKSVPALNEVTLDKGVSPRTMDISVYVSGCLVSNMNSDGLIISTPTGSTAYSMSVGGAITAPQMEAILLTAIAPYTLSIRPLIVNGDENIEIRYRGKDGKNLPSLTMDGQVRFEMPVEGTIKIKRAEYKARLVNYHRRSFYDILRTKLGWGALPAVKD